jgi:hypothetical protein
MQFGRKIYCNNSTGVVLCDTGERQGAAVETTQNKDFTAFSQLQGVDPSTVGSLQLAYGERDDEFANMVIMSVDTATQTLTIKPQVATEDSTSTST